MAREPDRGDSAGISTTRLRGIFLAGLERWLMRRLDGGLLDGLGLQLSSDIGYRTFYAAKTIFLGPIPHAGGFLLVYSMDSGPRTWVQDKSAQGLGAVTTRS